MRNPEVEALDLSSHTENSDEEIKVTVSKTNFEIQGVEVIVVDKNGEVIEEGKAKKAFLKSGFIGRAIMRKKRRLAGFL